MIPVGCGLEAHEKCCRTGVLGQQQTWSPELGPAYEVDASLIAASNVASSSGRLLATIWFVPISW